jgi:hypothetical protein
VSQLSSRTSPWKRLRRCVRTYSTSTSIVPHPRTG